MPLSRYSHARTSPRGAGDARPTAEQVLQDRNLVGNYWQHKIILITGGTTGLGAESARVLHMTGAQVFITGRDCAKGERVAEEISAANPKFPPVQMIEMDQNSFQSVGYGATEFLKKTGGKLNVLMLNAGVMGCSPSKTKEGFEVVFGVNHLAHFLLFHLLKQALFAASTPTFHSRVVLVSSSGHRASDLEPDDYNLEGYDVYDPAKAYAQSKTANIHMANEIERRYGGRGVHGLSLNPGLVLSTEIGRDLPGSASARREQYMQQDPLLAQYEKNLQQGTATQVWASVAQELEGKGGLYLEDLQVAQEADDTEPPQYFLPGWKRWIWDEKMATRLWKDSLKMIGLLNEE
ncbi:MAG: hypothetical protein Q9160_005619 [Pyrenula sp. 1 TL-2023]